MGYKVPVKIRLNSSLLTGFSTKVSNYGINNALVELYLNVDIKSMIITPVVSEEIKDNYSVFELYKIESDISPDIKDNKITLNISGKTRIKEFHSNTNITKSKEIDRLNKELNKHIEDIIKKNFNSMREKYNTDIFSFRQSFYRGNPKYYNTHYKDTWYESIFPNLTLEVKSNIKLYEKGNTLGGIEYENKNN